MVLPALSAIDWGELAHLLAIHPCQNNQVTFVLQAGHGVYTDELRVVKGLISKMLSEVASSGRLDIILVGASAIHP